MAESTIFDSVFKTMVEKTPELVIPLINEAFGRDYPLNESFYQYQNEHETLNGRRVTDSLFAVRDTWYHIECQSTDDSRMVVRMIEYDFSIALERALREGAPYKLRFPESCVLYLRSNGPKDDSLQMRVELPSGEEFDYSARAMHAQAYGSQEIFAKRLLFLLPFYIMRYEGKFESIAKDEFATASLLEEMALLRSQLESVAVEEDSVQLYESLVELMVRVSDYVLANQDELMKEVRRSMGGEVLVLMSDRIAAERQAAREEGLIEGKREGYAEGKKSGLKEGREEGLEQGLEQGREQGLEQGRDSLAKTLLELGVDTDLLERAMKQVSSEG